MTDLAKVIAWARTEGFLISDYDGIIVLASHEVQKGKGIFNAVQQKCKDGTTSADMFNEETLRLNLVKEVIRR